MRKTLFLVILIAGLVGTLVVSAAPSYIIQRTILPEASSTYEIGTSTQTWKGGYFDNLFSGGYQVSTSTGTLSSSTIWGLFSGVSPISYDGSGVFSWVNPGFITSTSTDFVSTSSAVSTYVPYTGANASLFLGANNISANIGNFNTLNATSATIGTINIIGSFTSSSGRLGYFNYHRRRDSFNYWRRLKSIRVRRNSTKLSK
jgi:hypothetical protein